MGILTERLTPAWVIQFYSGIKTIGYACSLLIVPFEISKGHAFRYMPFNDFPETPWRVGFRIGALVIWLAVFFWAGGRLWPSTTRLAETPPKN